MARHPSRSKFEGPGEDRTSDEEAAMPYAPDPDDERELGGAEGARRRHEHNLLAMDGVQGVAIGRNAIGDPAIIVYIREPDVRSRLPSSLDGYDVEPVVTGEIDVLPA